MSWLDDVKARCEAATPGPWYWRSGHHVEDPKKADAGGLHTWTLQPITRPDGSVVMNDNVAFPVAVIGGRQRGSGQHIASEMKRLGVGMSMEIIAKKEDQRFIERARTDLPFAMEMIDEAKALIEDLRLPGTADSDDWAATEDWLARLARGPEVKP